MKPVQLYFINAIRWSCAAKFQLKMLPTVSGICMYAVGDEWVIKMFSCLVCFTLLELQLVDQRSIRETFISVTPHWTPTLKVRPSDLHSSSKTADVVKLKHGRLCFFPHSWPPLKVFRNKKRNYAHWIITCFYTDIRESIVYPLCATTMRTHIHDRLTHCCVVKFSVCECVIVRSPQQQRWWRAQLVCSGLQWWASRSPISWGGSDSPLL